MWVLVLQTVLLCCLMLFGLTSTLVSALPILLSYYFYLLGWSLSIFLTVLKGLLCCKVGFWFCSFYFYWTMTYNKFIGFWFLSQSENLFIGERILIDVTGRFDFNSVILFCYNYCVYHMIFHDGFLWPFKHFSVFKGLYFFLMLIFESLFPCIIFLS